jgi:hypothetical protein
LRRFINYADTALQRFDKLCLPASSNLPN